MWLDSGWWYDCVVGVTSCKELGQLWECPWHLREATMAGAAATSPLPNLGTHSETLEPACTSS